MLNGPSNSSSVEQILARCLLKLLASGRVVGALEGIQNIRTNRWISSQQVPPLHRPKLIRCVSVEEGVVAHPTHQRSPPRIIPARSYERKSKEIATAL